MSVVYPPNDLASDAVNQFIARSHKLYIDGEWQTPTEEGAITVLDPATGMPIAKVPLAGREDVDRAVKAARTAFEEGPWSRMTPIERSKYIWRLADLIERHAGELAQIESIDAGKIVAVTQIADIPLSAAMMHYMAGWASKVDGETFSFNRPGEYHGYTLREPVGVAALIVPWNFPLVLTCFKLGPALAAGCTVIIKPAEQTPLSALRLADLVSEAGFPNGVINILTGDGPTSGAALASHPGVDKISFTGSTEVGKGILRAASGNLKRVTLELGGKSPMFVFPDADLDKVIPGCSSAIFFNQGQTCTAGSRLYVHRKVYDRVVAGIADGVRSLVPGHGLDPATSLAPVVSESQATRVARYIDLGLSAGAEAVVGGSRLEREGYFIAPTVLANTHGDMAVVREEIFGPVLTAMPFDDDTDLDTLAAIGNDTPFGLAASVWTTNLSTAHKMARRLKAGTVWLNTHNHYEPAAAFGGAKESGWGRECGIHGVHLFTETKTVIAAL
ncbi:aldehyde dehydrogenase family protein [Sphingobium sp. Sx8-8]|uniref:aldehyde dehydrogenase family protein n=1 Tax=Sphingobium sp. Sx8-8 TaxID=2933617 RepID=UPI001F5896C5|nr:aldehyde dehydrogenase family protein [Sphingobium sp. Sx8-8]